MKPVLVLNGPNLNLLGTREPEVYGSVTLADIEKNLSAIAKQLKLELQFFQSNSEGALIDRLQEARTTCSGVIFNPGAYTHTSIALLDALKAVGLPAVEVHITDPDNREEYRRISYIRAACLATIKGRGLQGYLDALHLLASEPQGR